MTSKRVTWIRWNLPYGVVKLTVLVVRNQGTSNAGKALIIGSDGTVAPGDAGGGGSGAVWGQITGDIANQTDLSNKLALYPIGEICESGYKVSSSIMQTLVKDCYQRASTGYSGILAHFKFECYVYYDNTVYTKIYLDLDLTAENNTLTITPLFCVVYPNDSDNKVTYVNVMSNATDGITGIAIGTVDNTFELIKGSGNFYFTYLTDFRAVIKN